MRPRLRIFTGDDEFSESLSERHVSMTFGEFYNVVSEACRYRSTWLRDFEQDEIQIPEDLYEVLTAYWSLRPGA